MRCLSVLVRLRQRGRHRFPIALSSGSTALPPLAVIDDLDRRAQVNETHFAAARLNEPETGTDRAASLEQGAMTIGQAEAAELVKRIGACLVRVATIRPSQVHEDDRRRFHQSNLGLFAATNTGDCASNHFKNLVASRKPGGTALRWMNPSLHVRSPHASSRSRRTRYAPSRYSPIGMARINRPETPGRARMMTSSGPWRIFRVCAFSAQREGATSRSRTASATRNRPMAHR